MFEVLLVNNDGGGFSEKQAVTEGTTISQFLQGRLNGDLKQYKIRLNGLAAAYDDVLGPDDRIVCTPLKIEGGC